jgi:glycine C-acetyltransferase
MYGKVQKFLQTRIAEIKSAGLYKQERVLTGPQQTRVTVSGGAPVLNLCANNYLGLANHPSVVQAAHTQTDLEFALVKFIETRAELRV